MFNFDNLAEAGTFSLSWLKVSVYVYQRMGVAVYLKQINFTEICPL